MNPRLMLILFLALVLGGGLAIGGLTMPDGWYAALAKPGFTPPGWVFGPAWTALYGLIAVAGWRVWMRAPRGPAMALWWAQLGLNFAWTPVFFRLHLIGLALAVILALLGVILGFIVKARAVDRLAAWLFAPYALWVGFATLLTAAIWRLN